MGLQAGQRRGEGRGRCWLPQAAHLRRPRRGAHGVAEGGGRAGVRKVYSSYISEGVDCDDLEELYEKVHEAIRENPVHEKKEGGDKPTRNGNEVSGGGKTWTRMVRLTFQERKDRVAVRIAKHAEKMLAED